MVLQQVRSSDGNVDGKAEPLRSQLGVAPCWCSIRWPCGELCPRFVICHGAWEWTYGSPVQTPISWEAVESTSQRWSFRSLAAQRCRTGSNGRWLLRQVRGQLDGQSSKWSIDRIDVSCHWAARVRAAWVVWAATIRNWRCDVWSAARKIWVLPVLGGSSHYSKWVKTPVINGYKWDTYCLQIAAGKFESLRRGPSWETVIVQGLQNLPCWLGLCKRPEVKAGWWEDIDLMTHTYDTHLQNDNWWYLDIIGSSKHFQHHSGSFFTSSLKTWPPPIVAPILGPILARQRPSIAIAQLSTFWICSWRCHDGSGCHGHGFDRDATTATTATTNARPLLNSWAMRPSWKDSTWCCAQCTQCLFHGDVWCHLFFAILWIFYGYSKNMLSMQCAKKWRKVCQRWYLAAVKSSVRKIPRSSQFPKAPAQFFSSKEPLPNSIFNLSTQHLLHLKHHLHHLYQLHLHHIHHQHHLHHLHQHHRHQLQKGVHISHRSCDTGVVIDELWHRSWYYFTGVVIQQLLHRSCYTVLPDFSLLAAGAVRRWVRKRVPLGRLCLSDAQTYGELFRTISEGRMANTGV